MNPFQMDPLEPGRTGRELTAAAAKRAEIEQALREGGRLRPGWLDRFANWWAGATEELRPGAALDPGPAPRGCVN
ncbi:hypothetical protein [Saccharopolyspora sp. 5N708]|uniref:hypothetical protein n=1 Tax=Saccharopolyspora sp. 5N708 TaxID=3457424 RepID=UPI003FD1FE1D